jgi:ubiquinone biosynthesis protein
LLNIEGLGRELDPNLDLWATAKPFLEKWMGTQVGPQKLMQQLKDQAPRYAKLLPELPGLIHAYLGREGHQSDKLLRELLTEQRRTNNLLQALMWTVLGFAVGLAMMQLVMRVRLF